MAKINWKTALSRAGIALCNFTLLGILSSVTTRLEGRTALRTSNWVTADYYGAVTAITNSNEFASTKQEMINTLKRDGESGYYKTVISIVNNPTMFSSSKIEAIKAISK